MSLSDVNFYEPSPNPNASASANANFSRISTHTHTHSGRKLGGGNYGAVYEGFKGDEDEPSVVIKETSSKAELVDGTLANFGLSELYMNQKLMLCGQASTLVS